MIETVVASPELVARVRAGVPALTREHLQARLAISETTWIKLRDGKPLKRSTLARLMVRLEVVADPDEPAGDVSLAA